MQESDTEILSKDEMLTEVLNIKPITVASCSIKELFNLQNEALPGTDISGRLTIPEYQRSYVWGDKQLLKLTADLKDFRDNYHPGNPHYYLGSIIIHQEGDQLNIIDGQQRITTLLLLSGLGGEISLPKISYSSPLSIQRIKQNIDFLKQLEQLPSIDLDLINVTLVVTQNEDDAYTFFETQNTGGVRLSGADIIKSHHLRAIKDKDVLNINAQKWETKSSEHIKYVIELLCKGRSWNIISWMDFPYYKYKWAIKNKIVEDFSERTIKKTSNVSYVQAEVQNGQLQNSIQLSSHLKSLRQPLHDGENFIDYLTEFVETYEMLFQKTEDYRIDSRFYKFRNELIHGNDGTLFLKELFEIAVLCYVSKFGLANIFEFSLWTFRYVYSLRVTKRRTVRENTLTKFVKEKYLLDKIFNCFTHSQVIAELQAYTYEFNRENCKENNVKGRYIKSLGNYFTSNFSNGIVIEDFDKKLKEDINDKL